MKKNLNLALILFYSFILHGKNMKLELTSSAFENNKNIPSKYTCDGINISPPLEWQNIPENTKTFSLIIEDPDAPVKTWIHWVVFNIPSKITNFDENIDASSFNQGATDFDARRDYGGPCPPSGTHSYHFKLYALDTIINLPNGSTKEQLLQKMQGHILDQTTLIGKYQRKNKEK
jgi:hypothetical protein